MIGDLFLITLLVFVGLFGGLGFYRMLKDVKAWKVKSACDVGKARMDWLNAVLEYETKYAPMIDALDDERKKRLFQTSEAIVGEAMLHIEKG